MGVGERSEKECALWVPRAVPTGCGMSFGLTLGLWVPAEGAGPLGVVVWGPSRLPPPQPQHSHLVIQQLLSHLDANSRSAATVRAGIVEVLSEAAVIAATGSVGKTVQSRRQGAGGRGRCWILGPTGRAGWSLRESGRDACPDLRVPPSWRPGPTVLEMFNTLLRQLRLSIDYALTGSYDGAVSLGTKIIKEHEERMFQEAVIKTIGAERMGWAWEGPLRLGGGIRGRSERRSGGGAKGAEPMNQGLARGRGDDG